MEEKRNPQTGKQIVRKEFGEKSLLLSNWAFFLRPFSKQADFRFVGGAEKGLSGESHGFQYSPV